MFLSKTSKFINKFNGIKRNFCAEQHLEELIYKPLNNNDDKGILVLAMNRPKQRNAINNNLLQSFENAIVRANSDNNIRVIILRSHIKNIFCAGADLKERLTMTPIQVHNFVNRLRQFMYKLENVNLPIITAIDGAALGGGLEMALATDIRVASNTAKIGLTETSLAIIPGAGGTQRLPRLIGVAKAKELIYTARILNGVEAKDYGIVNHCVQSNDNDDCDAAYRKSLEIAREILSNGPIGVKMAKLAINNGVDVSLARGCSIEELCYAQVITTKDRIEGLKAFKEKRRPIYCGE